MKTWMGHSPEQSVVANESWNPGFQCRGRSASNIWNGEDGKDSKTKWATTKPSKGKLLQRVQETANSNLTENSGRSECVICSPKYLGIFLPDLSTENTQVLNRDTGKVPDFFFFFKTEKSEVLLCFTCLLLHIDLEFSRQKFQTI